MAMENVSYVMLLLLMMAVKLIAILVPKFLCEALQRRGNEVKEEDKKAKKGKTQRAKYQNGFILGDICRVNNGLLMSSKCDEYFIKNTADVKTLHACREIYF